MAENVYSSARVLKDDKKVEKYELSNFLKNKVLSKEESHDFIESNLEKQDESNLEKTEVKNISKSMNIVDNSAVLEKIEPIFAEFEKMIKKLKKCHKKLQLLNKMP